METEVNSLRNLSEQIDGILKKYDIDGFICEFKNSFKKINSTAYNQLEELNKNDIVDGSHFDMIMAVSKSLSDEDLAKVVKVSKRLNKKYNVENFSKEAEAARKDFLEKRNNYFSVKATKGNDKETLFNDHLDQTGITDIMLASWISKLLARIYPYSLKIRYEDFNGKIVDTRITHREPIVTTEYVECPLITRYHGKNNYDRFLMFSFFDANRGKWVYIPLRLIIDLTSPEGINIYDIDIPTE